MASPRDISFACDRARPIESGPQTPMSRRTSPPSTPGRPKSPRRDRAAAAWLAAIAFVAYLPALRGGFIWDDDAYVTNNPLLHDAQGLWRIWTDLTATPQYYPLVHTSFWMETH